MSGYGQESIEWPAREPVPAFGPARADGRERSVVPVAELRLSGRRRGTAT
jgi:hypothetical protein